MQGLIHRARVLTRTRAGSRNAQGEYVDSDPPTPGPWIKARLMERGAVAAERRMRDNTTDARVSRPYELLVAPLASDGSPVVLTASSIVETDCPILGSPTLELSGEPEKLNQGRRHIGWMSYAAIAKDAA